MDRSLPTLFRLSPPAQVNGNYVLFTNSMQMWVCAFITTAINVALPTIQGQLRLSPIALGWLPLAYILATAAFLVPFGKIADRVGRRRIYLTGILIFAVCSLALVFSDAYIPLVIFRAGQGFGAAMIFASSTAIVTLSCPPERRGRAMGLYVGAAYLGQTMGPSVGGVIVHNLGWHSLFVLTGALSLIVLALDLWLLRGAEWKEEIARGFDWSGSTVYVLALSAFVLGLSWLSESRGAILLAIGVIGLAIFIWWEGRVRNPVLDVVLFRHNRTFAFSNAAALINYAAVWAMSFLMSLYLQYIKGLNAEKAGLVLIAGVAVQAAFSPFTGRLSDRVQPRWVASAGMVLCACGLFSFSFLTSATPYWVIIAGLCVLGLGFALFSGPNQSAIMGSVERKFVGIASASVGTMRMVGQAISIGVATLVLALVVGSHDIAPAAYPHVLTSVKITFGVMTVLCVLGVFASLSRGKLPSSGHHDEVLQPE